MAELQRRYAGRGVNLVRVAGRWTFRTASDLSWLLAREDQDKRKLSRAAIETLAIVAYHQPVTRADIEEIRGVAVSKGALDVLMEAGWVRMRGRRKAPGRPITYGTTPGFLVAFRPRRDRRSAGPRRTARARGCSTASCRPDSAFPSPTTTPRLRADEEPLDGADAARTGLGAGRRGGRALRASGAATKAPKITATTRLRTAAPVRREFRGS